jgi:hypothetical protein
MCGMEIGKRIVSSSLGRVTGGRVVDSGVWSGPMAGSRARRNSLPSTKYD